jgi:hypothetical protein
MGKTTEMTDAALVGIQRDQIHWFFWGIAGDIPFSTFDYIILHPYLPAI